MNAQPTLGRNSGRILELDGLRALAVLAVIAFHYTLNTPLANRATGLGWMGVDLFFVLSGYLITSILLAARERPRYFTTFYARRTLRIFPVYYLLLAVYVLAAWGCDGPQPWRYWGMQAAFLSSTVEYFRSWIFAAPAFVYAGVTVLWSLSIEEQFYLIWAPVVKWLRPTGLWIFLGAIVAGAPWLRHSLHTHVFLEYRFLPARFDSLAWGALLALGWRRWSAADELGVGPARAARRFGAIGAGAGAVLAVLVGLTGGRRESLWFATFGYTALAILFAAIVGWTVLRAGGRSPVCRLLRLPTARYLGKISYVVYLIHYPMLLLIGGWLGPFSERWPGGAATGTVARDLLSLAATLLVAGASWRWLEAPLLRLKNHWEPARARQAELIGDVLRRAEVASSVK